MGEVYIVGKLEGHCKIGRSSDAEARLNSFSPKLPVQLAILHRITTGNEVWLERVLHLAYRHRRSLGEWFKLEDCEVELLKTMQHVDVESDLPQQISLLLKQRGGIEDARVNLHPPLQSSKPKPVIPLPLPTAKIAKPSAIAESLSDKDEKKQVEPFDYWQYDMFEVASPVYGRNRFIFRYFGEPKERHMLYDGDVLIFCPQSTLEMDGRYIARINGVTHICHCRPNEDGQPLLYHLDDDQNPINPLSYKVLGRIEHRSFSMASREFAVCKELANSEDDYTEPLS